MSISSKALENLRNRLLDLTFRNKLINFKHNRSCLRVIDELPDQLAEALLSGSTMKFIPINEPTKQELIDEGYIGINPESKKETTLKKDPSAKEWAKVKGFDVGYRMPKNYNSVDSKHKDNDIQTLLYPYEMESTLKKIHNLANVSIKETGSNILYLSFGFLEWKDDTQNRSAIAPLFLVPVTIEKGRLNAKKGVYEYTIKHSGDEIIENLSLKEKLKTNFGLVLPGLTEKDSPEGYFKKIEELIQKNRPEWILERFVTLGLLNFSKLLMYLDLSPSNWPKGAGLLDHPVTSQLLGGINTDPNNSKRDNFAFDFMEEYEVDTLNDVHNKYPLIFDADSSQHSAIVDAIDGKSLVVEGPPGTGKSQTIANLIGAVLSQGKSVLFMSEKQAALNVVYEKLASAGLGGFCLNLHSHKSQKREIFESLKKRILSRNSFPKPSEIDDEIKHYEKLKEDLSGYVSLVNKEWKKSGHTIHQILNAAVRYQESLTLELLSIFNLDVENIDKNIIKNYEDQLKNLIALSENAIKSSRKGTLLNEHEWYGFNNYDIQSYEYDNLKNLLNLWNESLEEYLDYELSVIEDFGFITHSDNFQGLPLEVSKINTIIDSYQYVDVNNLHKINVKDLNYLDECLSIFVSLNFKKDNLLKVIPSETINSFLTSNNLPKLPDLALANIDNKISIEDLSNELGDLYKIQSDLKDIDALMRQVKVILGAADLNLTLDGLRVLSDVIQILKIINPYQISKRNIFLDRGEVEELLPELKSQVIFSRNIKNKLDSIYNFEILPDSDRLKSIEEILSEESFVKWFKWSYREARKEILGYSKNKYIKIDELLSGLNQIYNYRDSVEYINSNHFINEFGDYLNGDSTDIELIESITAWYSKIRQAFGSGFGESFKFRDMLKNLQDSSLTELHTLLANNQFDLIDDTVLTISNLQSNLKDSSSLLLDINSPVIMSIKSAEEVLSFAEKISFFPTFKLPIEELVSLYKQLSEYTTLKISWLSIDESRVYFKQDKNKPKSQKEIDTVKSTLSFLRLITSGLKNTKLSEFIFHKPLKDSIPALKEINSNLESKFDKTINKYNNFKELSKLDINQWLQGNERGFPQIINKNLEAYNRFDSLNYWVDYIRRAGNIHSKELKPLVQYFSDCGSYSNSIPILNSYIFNKLSKDILKNNKVLENFSSVEHNNKLSEFIKCDNELKELQKKMIMHKTDASSEMTQGVSTGAVGEWTEEPLVRKEVDKKARHISIRSLIDRAPKTIKSIKPCFMMSPMSVSQFLKPGKMVFDLVIMDEASQIRPQDALGTIARGKQVIIVGDPKQLPPFNLFQVNGIDEDEDEITIAEEQESILDAALGILPLRTLRWHYRSRHQSLIAFSNYEFYDDNLVIFPSPVESSESLGIRYSRIDNGTFVRNRNIEEARVVALAVRSHMLNNPEESLGVVAMNVIQRNQIEDEIEILAKEGDANFANILEKNRNKEIEGFFVKNLENVQGDERDVIYISMTYGPKTIGGRVPKVFGVNTVDGWRRLNVLFTRSKRRMHVFSSFESSDVPNTGKRGVTALNAFLRYCETGKISRSDVELNRAPDSDFEIAVMKMLNLHGFECVPQVGEAGFFIDISVRDPNKPGRFLMAIECDGATYHSSKSARDRDRLKQQVLEGLGWNVRRIWSTDWFRNPRAALEPIVKELKELKSEPITIESGFNEEREIDDIVADQDSLKAFDNMYAGLNLDIKEKLISFNNNEIIKEFPNTKEENRLLSSFMIDAFVEHQPYDKTEFLELIPEYIREHVDRYESAKYLNDVLNIIANSISEEL